MQTSSAQVIEQPRLPIGGTKLPDFLFIWAQKAGTTALANYLAAHPSIVPHKWKEVHYFDLNYEKGVKWYLSHFEIGRRQRMANLLQGKRLVTGDATPYYLLHPRAADRACALVPRARIIIMLRDPVV